MPPPPTESLVLDGYNIFANFGELHAVYPQPDLAQSDATVVETKQATEEWKAYLRWRGGNTRPRGEPLTRWRPRCWERRLAKADRTPGKLAHRHRKRLRG